jgi:very-short-patch-repair endonuclease
MPKTPKEKCFCVLCGKKLIWGRVFCSRECKSLSQIKRITLACLGCGKEFQIRPYLKRDTNFCSLKCYRSITITKETRLCNVCGRKFIATGKQIRDGFGIYCSRDCQHATYPKRIKKVCPQCQKVYWVPPSWAPKRTFCSKKCQDDSMRDYVKSVCKKCGKTFELPRGDLERGRGHFCTYRCYLTYRGPSTLEEKMERVLNLVGIKFEREIKFKRFHVDFLIRNLKTVIECDGEYWHLMPKIQDRDRRKDELLKSLGYKVLRFSGETIDKLSELQLANRILNL